IPIFTDQVLTFLSDEQNREKIKSFLADKISEYSANTFSEVNYSAYDHVLNKYGYSEGSAAREGLGIRIANLQDEEWKFTTILFSCILLLVMGLLFAPRVNSTELTFMVISSFIVLGLGLILPMIEIDARMDEIKFTLLGETIRFEDQ